MRLLLFWKPRADRLLPGAVYAVLEELDGLACWPPLLPLPLPDLSCLPLEEEASSDDSLLALFWLDGVLLEAATFSMRFRAIFE